VKVAFQGERGAYSEAAAIGYFNNTIEPIPCMSFDDVFTNTESGKTDVGIVPIENSLAGSIHRNYDLLLRHNLNIVGEKNFRVRHCLIANPNVTLAEIRFVTSHPQALAQCENFIKRLGLKIEPAYDTAGSVKLLTESGRRDTAAIASEYAATVYKMSILAKDIEDDETNFTRFLILGKEPKQADSPSKTSIVFSLQNIPGALYQALSFFSLKKIDLTKIESRPIPGSKFEYSFYLDFVGNIHDTQTSEAISNLEKIATSLRILGSYEQDVRFDDSEKRRYYTLIQWE
jgi:prephenate dehydratase